MSNEQFIEELRATLKDIPTEELLEFSNEIMIDSSFRKEYKDIIQAVIMKEYTSRKAQSIREITKHMHIAMDYIQVMHELQDTYQDTTLKAMSLFNYGYMMGKREERARRKANR